MFQKITHFVILLFMLGLASNSNAQVTLLDYECDASSYTIFGFGAADFGPITAEVLPNPDMSGENTSAHVLHINKPEGGQDWAGATTLLFAPIDFSGGTSLSVKVWAPNPGTTFMLKIEDTNSPPDGNGNPSIIAEVQAQTTVGGEWETLTYDMSTFADFDANNSYNQAVFFPDFGNIGGTGGTDYYIDDLMNPSGGPILPVIPLGFEGCGVNYNPAGFGDINFGPIPTSISANPFIDANNESATVWNITKTQGAQTWAGASMDLGAPIDFSATNSLSVKFYSQFSGIPVQLKIEDVDSPPDMNGNPTVFAEVVINSTVNGGWETMIFDMSTFGNFDASVEYERLVLFPDFGNTPFIGEIPFYFDDVQLELAAEVKPSIPVDFESDDLTYSFGVFGGVDLAERIDNPDPSGENTSSKVMEIHKMEGAETWAGAFLDLQTPADLSNPIFSLKVWAPEPGTPITLKLENADDNSLASEIMMTTIGGGAWETLTYDLSLAGTFDPMHIYNRVVIFPNIGNMGVVGGASYYFDDLEQAAPPRPKLPIDFESNNLQWDLWNFGGVDIAERIPNPDPTGENTSATVLRLNKSEGAETWAGMTQPLSSPIDFSNSSTLAIKVWSPAAGTPIQLKIEDTTSPPDMNGNPSVFAEVISNTTLASAWETLQFDMTGHPSFMSNINYDQVVIFPNFGNPGLTGGTDYYFDDLVVYLPPVVLPDLPITFEDPNITYTNIGFGNLNSTVVSNPDASGINTSATVIELEKTMGAEVWAGVSIPVQNPIDFNTANGSTFSIKIWSPRADIPVLFKIEDLSTGNPPTVFVEQQQNTTTANQWETVVFDVGIPDPNAIYNNIVIFPDFGNSGMGETFYVDDIMSDMPVNVTDLDLEKIELKVFPNPTEDILNVKFEIPVSGQITFDVIDLLGSKMQNLDLGTLPEGKYNQVMNLKELASGSYFLLMKLDGQIISNTTLTVR